MSTKANLTITDSEWQDLNTLTGVAVGTAIQVQNVSTTVVLMFESDTPPDTSSYDGMQLLPANYFDLSKADISSGSKKIWVRLQKGATKAILAVTE